MQRVGQGDRQAYAVLVRRHLSRMVSLAVRVLGSRAEAEEVAQESMLRVWTQAPKWSPDGARFTTWLYRVTLNLCLDRKRRAPNAALDEVPEPADERPDALEGVAHARMAQALRKALAALPERQRAAIALCLDDGLSQQEAAAALGVSEGAIESLLVRARRTLRDQLGPMFRDWKEA
ncbi:RNA polymerase sigma factor [Zavarzinia sp. CC-PAN008]|uniref:RNA polymerase sigma factor n=1 Tax=Zavarzinia sp. CC-PAN008 TaxID=3243332 RepID=UPI003F749607